MRHEFNGRYNPDKFAAVESCLCKQTFPTFNKPIQNQERKKRRNFSTRFARLASRCARSKKEKSNKSCARPRSHGASSNDIKMESAVSEVNQNRVAWPGSKLSKPVFSRIAIEYFLTQMVFSFFQVLLPGWCSRYRFLQEGKESGG